MTQELNETGIVLANVDDAKRFALMITQSQLCPKQYAGKPHDALIAIVAGRAVGLNPIQALSGIAVVNGRPSMYGEARSAVVLASGKVEWVKEWFEDGGQTVNPQGQYAKLADFPAGLTACWQAKRADATQPSQIVRFSVGDAKMANLWGKPGPWTQYPLRMLQMRARAFGERDHFADATQGIAQAEEMVDIARRHDKDPLEKAEPVIDAEPVAEVQLADEPASLDAKLALLNEVSEARQGCESSMSDGVFIVAVCDAELKKHRVDTLGELERVRAALFTRNEYDWATGERIPPAGQGKP